LNPDLLLLIAARRNNIELIKLLLTTWPDTDLNVSLPAAVENGSFKAVKYLISKGADPCSDDNILVYAAQSGSLSIFKYLVRLGCKVDFENDDTLMFAAMSGQIDLVEYLLDLGYPKIDSALTTAIDYRQLDLAQALIHRGANVETYRIEDLHFMVGNEMLDDILPFVLSKGVFSSERLVNPLNGAISIKRYDLVKLLISHGADTMTIKSVYLNDQLPEHIAYLLRLDPRLIAYMSAKTRKMLQDCGYNDSGLLAE
jgi:ankyrin repeat protein